MDIKDRIINMYFNEKMKQKEIADKLHISKYKVSRIVSKNNMYLEEKERRKIENQEKHKNKKIEAIYLKRKKAQIENEILRKQHIQASLELSSSSTISNRAFKKWNSSIYRYNPKTKSYNVKSGIGLSYNIPKKINWS